MKMKTWDEGAEGRCRTTERVEVIRTGVAAAGECLGSLGSVAEALQKLTKILK